MSGINIQIGSSKNESAKSALCLQQVAMDINGIG